MNDRGMRACAVCGVVLLRVRVAGQSTFEHLPNEGADHPAVPVRTSEIRTNFRCDFCSADNAAWTLPVDDYLIDGSDAKNVGDWAACEACAALLQSDRWSLLIDRAFAAHRRKGGPAQRFAFVQMYRQLRLHITGAIYVEPATVPEPDR